MTHEEIMAELGRLERELARLRESKGLDNYAERVRVQEDTARLAAALLDEEPEPKPASP